MNITQRLHGNCTDIGPRRIDFIVMHYAMTNSFDTVYNAFTSNGTSAHYCAGPNGQVVQYVPDSLVAWHAGNWQANCASIGVETLCSLRPGGNPNNSHDWIFDSSTLETLSELYAYIAKKQGWSRLVLGQNVRYHSSCSPTSCPGDLRDTNLGQQVVDRANAILSGGKVPSAKPSPAPSPSQSPAVEAWNKQQVADVNGLRIRAAQNTSSKVIGTLNAGDRFNATRIARNGENVNGYTTWFEVNGRGWVSGAFVTPVGSQSAPQSSSQSGTFTFSVPTNIRAGASTSSAIVGSYAPGQSVNYDSVVHNEGITWLSYIGSSGARRYVAKL